jgi:DNA (cytosine-5)-methyltransferase 1
MFDSPPQETNITLAEASIAFEVSYDTIRRWEKKGLIKAKRDKMGHRQFSRSEIERLQSKLSGQSTSQYGLLNSQTPSPYSVIELFAGAGGLALGFSNAGLITKKLVEIDKFAASTLRLNHPDWDVVEDDIRHVSLSSIKADVVAGGFPCQAFSYAGKQLGFEDIRGTLFFEFARIIKEVNPKVICGENVRGLEKHDNGRTLKTMLGVLDELGYKAEYKILRSQYLDVPQKRERLVILGVRKDLNLPIIFPSEKDYTVSLREALKDVPESLGQKYTPHKKAVMDLGGGKTGMARRLAWDEPSLTLTCNPAQKQTERCHPQHTRPLTTREYARIQCFPDNWQFSGSTAQIYKQIGNAVPVNLGFHIGRAIIDILDAKSL